MTFDFHKHQITQPLTQLDKKGINNIKVDYFRWPWMEVVRLLYHLYNRRCQHLSSVMTAGRRELLEDGHRRRIRRGHRTF